MIKSKAISLLSKSFQFFPLSPYKKLSKADYLSFKNVFDIWKPKSGPTTFLLRWEISQWCNYNCFYCPQTHDRFAKDGNFTAHAFDNYPVENWIDAIKRNFQNKNISLVISGGEPFLDWRNMNILLGELTAMENVISIRIDTNASWNPKKYEDLDKSKIILMCTYHPSQVVKEKYLKQIDQIIQAGFKIGIVNYVMVKENLITYEETKKEFSDRNLILHPNPLWDSEGKYSEEEYSFLGEHLPKLDYKYRAQTATPLGKKCLFPAVAYELNHKGEVIVGCHDNTKKNIMEELPQSFAGPVPCPAKSCVCLDKYSFLKESKRNTTLNPLEKYVEELTKL